MQIQGSFLTFIWVYYLSVTKLSDQQNFDNAVILTNAKINGEQATKQAENETVNSSVR